jgi:hypothetical protein
MDWTVLRKYGFILTKTMLTLLYTGGGGVESWLFFCEVSLSCALKIRLYCWGQMYNDRPELQAFCCITTRRRYLG